MKPVPRCEPRPLTYRVYDFEYMTENECTEDAWERVKEYKSETESKYVAGVFVDFKGAFDFLLWRVILEKLIMYRFTDAEVKVWRSFFENRCVHM